MTLDIVMPVHNEAEGIFDTVKEWVEKTEIPLRFIFVEDGSSDNTLLELARIVKEWGGVIISSKDRGGYSRAVVQGVRRSSADAVLVVDSDGQCDPADLQKFTKEYLTSGQDFISGVRSPRKDSFLRKAASVLFRAYWRILGGDKMTDPSAPYVLGSGDAFRRLAQEDPYLVYGYWWEFHLRRKRAGMSCMEIETHHRQRRSGDTQIYDLKNLLALGLSEARLLRNLSRNLG